ncbi:MAG: hypothetical protein GF383_04800, partial [Candidatus Lokiarchaeota archaeon]|nr:hypothetical protein [Candidatus Lokiarchaeota archaeon]MBD3339133.1 hypothetical protein [Candidatus Lokiarchaeota archaeon]
SDLSFLTDLKSLTSLEIDSCGLTSIPVIQNLARLEMLNLSDNHLASLESVRNIQDCDNLKEINLQYNRITDICGFEPLTHLPGLRFLRLNNNLIRNFKITARIPNLYAIWLGHNKIRTVSGLENLPSCKGFNFEHNRISSLSDIRTAEVMPHVRGLYFEHNRLCFLDFSLLRPFPNLEELEFYKNPIEDFTGLETLPRRTIAKGIDSKFIVKIDTFIRLRKYAQSHGWDFWGIEGEDPGTLAYGGPLLVHKIGDFLEVRLYAPKRVETFVDGRQFLQCKFLLVNLDMSNEKEAQAMKQINSIDDAEQLFVKHGDNIALENQSRNRVSTLSDEEIFRAHASNLQAWAEHDYDTRLLHRSLAFPLLKELAEAGDPQAKRVFREEIAKRFKNGNATVREYLRVRGFLKHLSLDEMDAI